MARKYFSGLMAVGFAFGVLFSGCSHKPVANIVHEQANYFGTSKVQRYTLPNGLKLLVLEDHSAPTFSYQTWFSVGSRDEKPGRTGLAHLFEHMMFKGTKVRKDGEFDRLLESAGAEGENAFTSRDYTGYVQSLPSSKLDLIASLEADRMVGLIVNKESLDKEREVVQNERRFRNENNPNGQLFERIYEVAYTKHSYHWPVIGYDLDLRNASPRDCENFYQRFYAPNNATIVVVGDVKPLDVLATVSKYYGALPASKIDRNISLPEPTQHRERMESMSLKSPVEKLVVGYHIPNANSEDFPAIEVAREILAGGKGSRLYRRLVDGGIATSVDLESAEHKDPGLLIMFINMQKGRTAKQALAVLDQEVRDMSAGHIKPEEIKRAISMHRFSVFDELASNFNKAQFIGFYETVAGNFERGVHVVNELGTIGKEGVAAVMKAYFRKDNRSIVIGTPTSGKGK